MWISNRVAEWVSDLKKDANTQAEVAAQALKDLREELAAVRAERDTLKLQIATTQNNFEWMRNSWNQTQAENKALLQRAYGIQVPVPELAKRGEPNFNLQNLFNDIGDEEARSQGLPTYDN